MGWGRLWEKETGHLGKPQKPSGSASAPIISPCECAWRQSVWGEKMMCRRTGSEGPERITLSCCVWPAWLQLASRQSPVCPIRSAGGSDIDNANKPVALLKAGMDAVGWQPPEKSKRISASQTRRHQSRSSGPGRDQESGIGQARAQIRIQTTNLQQWRALNRACALTLSTAASADAVSPRRHRHSRYMLCIIPIMYLL